MITKLGLYLLEIIICSCDEFSAREFSASCYSTSFPPSIFDQLFSASCFRRVVFGELFSASCFRRVVFGELFLASCFRRVFLDSYSSFRRRHTFHHISVERIFKKFQDRSHKLYRMFFQNFEFRNIWLKSVTT